MTDEKKSNGLRRLDTRSDLAALNVLTDSDKRELQKDYVSREIRSRMAEGDMATALDAADRANQDRRIFSVKKEGETGSGRYEIHIRGGDANFIVPVILAVGAVIALLVAVLAWR